MSQARPAGIIGLAPASARDDFPKQRGVILLRAGLPRSPFSLVGKEQVAISILRAAKEVAAPTFALPAQTPQSKDMQLRGVRAEDGMNDGSGHRIIGSLKSFGLRTSDFGSRLSLATEPAPFAEFTLSGANGLRARAEPVEGSLVNAFLVLR
jgi:hypothetical protein